MNVLLQRHCAKYIYAVPDGLRELMTDISREVLRTQPENLYTFIADYLDALMITRENARVAARLVEHITEISITIVELLLRTGMTREQADDVARVIQLEFRRYIRRKERKKIMKVYGTSEVYSVGEDEAEEEGNRYGSEEEQFVGEIMEDLALEKEKQSSAAKIIQAAFRKFKQRQEYEQDLLYGMVDWRIAARHTISLYRHAGVSEAEANRAATLIKSAYKGYYTRRVMKKLLEKGLKAEEEEEESDSSNAEIPERSGGSIESGMELDDDEDQKKSVRINFDTVKPHVDYDYEPTVIGGVQRKGLEGEGVEGEMSKGEGVEGGGQSLDGGLEGEGGQLSHENGVPAGVASVGVPSESILGESVRGGSARGVSVKSGGVQVTSIQGESVVSGSVLIGNIPSGAPPNASEEGVVISKPSADTMEVISGVQDQGEGQGEAEVQGESTVQGEGVNQGQGIGQSEDIRADEPVEGIPSEPEPNEEVRATVDKTPEIEEEPPIEQELPPSEPVAEEVEVLANEAEVNASSEGPNEPGEEGASNEPPLETVDVASEPPTEPGDTTDRTDFTTATETTTGEETSEYTTDDTGEATDD